MEMNLKKSKTCPSDLHCRREIEIKQAILAFLAKWNPIGVPEDIAKDEYINYVDLIESSLRSKDELRKCLIGILRETMGLDISSPEAFADIENACDELMNICLK